jgi:hypothetical protein
MHMWGVSCMYRCSCWRRCTCSGTQRHMVCMTRTGCKTQQLAGDTSLCLFICPAMNANTMVGTYVW